MRDNKLVGGYFVKSFTLADRKEFVRLCKQHDKDEQELTAQCCLRYVLADDGKPAFPDLDALYLADAVECETLMVAIVEHNKMPSFTKERDALQEFKFSLAGHLGKTVKELEVMDEAEFFRLVQLLIDAPAVS